MEKKSMRVSFGETLVELGKSIDNLVVLDADLAHATMSYMFQDAYPNRFFNFGIAECNMVAEAAGMAHSGLNVIACTFGVFGTGRAYEIVRNSVCYTKANVKLACSHSGLCAGEDGGSHQMLEDISLMRSLPNMTVVVPCDPKEAVKATKAVANMYGPAYLRVGRIPVDTYTNDDTPFEIGKANVMKDGSDLCIIACGLMVGEALKAAELLAKEGINAAVVNMHTIKPIDSECILSMAQKCGTIITIEEHSVIGGLGTAVAEVLAGNSNAKFARIGVNDKFGQSGSPEELFREYGLTAENIIDTYHRIK